MRNQSRTRMMMVAAALLACGSAKVLLAQNAPGAGPAPVETPVLVPAQPSQATTSPPAAPPPAVAAPAPAVAATPPAASAPPAAAAPVPAATTKTPAVLAPEPTVATTPPASGPAASTPGASVATSPAGSPKQGAQKKPTRVTRRHELERSIETGTVPERFRNSVPKEYQQYIPFAK